MLSLLGALASILTIPGTVAGWFTGKKAEKAGETKEDIKSLEAQRQVLDQMSRAAADPTTIAETEKRLKDGSF
jgi:hypothetical protein